MRLSMLEATFSSKISSPLSTSFRIRSVRTIVYPLILAISSLVSVFQEAGRPTVISNTSGFKLVFTNLANGSLISPLLIFLHSINFKHHVVSILDILFQFFEGLALAKYTGYFSQSSHIPLFIYPVLQCKTSFHSHYPSTSRMK